MRDEKYTPEQMIDAIRASGGVIAEAARMLDCSRNTVMRYREKYDAVKEAYEEENEVHLDKAERTLVDYVDGIHTVTLNGETLTAPLDAKTRLDALKFYLRTKGKDRGYNPRQEVTGADGKGVPLTIQIINDPNADD